MNQAEALSRRHWTLVYLFQNPDWRGEGVLVDKHGLRGRIIIPELALEVLMQLAEHLELNSVLGLSIKGINLPELEAHFELI